MRAAWYVFGAACLVAILTGCALRPHVVFYPDPRDPIPGFVFGDIQRGWQLPNFGIRETPSSATAKP